MARGQPLPVVRIPGGVARLDAGCRRFQPLRAGAPPRTDRAARRQPLARPDRQHGRHPQHDGPARLGRRRLRLRHPRRLHRSRARAGVQHPALQRVHRPARLFPRHLGFRRLPLHRRPRHGCGTDGRHSATGRGAGRKPPRQDRRLHDDRRRARRLPGRLGLWPDWRLRLARGILHRRGAGDPDRRHAPAHDGARAVPGSARTPPGA